MGNRATIKTADITLVAQLIGEFEGGIEVINGMSDEAYTAGHGKNGSFGAHFSAYYRSS